MAVVVLSGMRNPIDAAQTLNGLDQRLEFDKLRSGTHDVGDAVRA
jgi:hypothetical protein